MKHVCVVLICVLTVLLASATRRVAALPPPQCSPTFQQEELPLKVRKVCAALNTFYELSNAMEAYLDDKAARDNNNPMVDAGVKRQDVDHVFLRFGRRR